MRGLFVFVGWDEGLGDLSEVTDVAAHPIHFVAHLAHDVVELGQRMLQEGDLDLEIRDPVLHRFTPRR